MHFFALKYLTKLAQDWINPIMNNEFPFLSIFEKDNILQQQEIYFSFVGLPVFFFFYWCGSFLSSWQNVKWLKKIINKKNSYTHQGTGKDSCMKVTLSCVQYMFSRKVLLKVFSAVQCYSVHMYNCDILNVSTQKHVSSQPRSSHISTGKNPQIAMNY